MKMIRSMMMLFVLLGCTEQSEITNIGDSDVDTDSIATDAQIEGHQDAKVMFDIGGGCTSADDCWDGQYCVFDDLGEGYCSNCNSCADDSRCDESIGECRVICIEDACIDGQQCINDFCKVWCNINTNEGCPHITCDDPDTIIDGGVDVEVCQELIYSCIDDRHTCVGQFNCDTDNDCHNSGTCEDGQCRIILIEDIVQDAGVSHEDSQVDSSAVDAEIIVDADLRCFCGSENCEDYCRACSTNSECGHPGNGWRCISNICENRR
jgi:hypothetical protein